MAARFLINLFLKTLIYSNLRAEMAALDREALVRE